MQRIMIIEDDETIREELALILRNEGYGTLPVTDYGDVPGQVSGSRPDLILLDIGLPAVDGFVLCAQIRQSVDVPVIFVTGRDSGLDEIRALSLGGDDYITKPYNIPVLLARIKSVLRRSAGGHETGMITAAGLRLDLARGTVSSEEGSVALGRNELHILYCLMRREGEIVSRVDLMEELWENRIYIDDNTLSVNVTRLRGHLAQIGQPDLIKTRRGMGYQL